MLEDFGYENWLKLKTRTRKGGKYTSSHSYIKKETKLIGNFKNKYLEIHSKNTHLKYLEIYINNAENNKTYNVNVNENCLISLNKKNNWLLEGLMNNAKINTSLMQGDDLNQIEIKDPNKEIYYQIKYKLKQLELKNNDNECAVSEQESRINKKEKRLHRKDNACKTISNKKQRKNEANEVHVVNSLEDIYSFRIIDPTNKFSYIKKKTKKIENVAENNEINIKNNYVKHNKSKLKTQMDLAVNDVIVMNKKYDAENKIEKLLREPLSCEPLLGSKSYTKLEMVNKRLVNDFMRNEKCKCTNESEESICDICYSTTDNIIKLDTCKHSACFDCWKTYTESQINHFKVHANGENDVQKITCLYKDCDSVLSLHLLSTVLPNGAVKRYIRFYCELKLIRSQEYLKCPRDECDRVIVINDNCSTPISICDCNYAICNKCRNEAHYPILCEEAAKFINEFDSEKLSKLTIPGKFCPSCRRFIEKNGGCNHMTCICGKEFCWLCCGDYYRHNQCRPIVPKNYNVSYFNSPKMQEIYELATRTNGLLPNSIINQDVNRVIQTVKTEYVSSVKHVKGNSFNALLLLDMTYKSLVQLNINLTYMISFCKYLAIRETINFDPTHENKRVHNILVSTTRLCFSAQKLLQNASSLDDVHRLVFVNSKLKERIEKLKF